MSGHAWAQAMWFARLEMRAPQAGQFSVSRLLTGYKYDLKTLVVALSESDAFQYRKVVTPGGAQ